MSNIIPIIPLAIDSWTMRDVATSATTIRTMAPKRSDQGARLKNSHHTTTANPPTSPPSIPTTAGLGHDDGDDKPDQPLQHHGDHAGPQPERLPRSRFVGLSDGHVRRYAPHRAFVPGFQADPNLRQTCPERKEAICVE